MQAKAALLPSVPAYVALVLVVGSFMLGHMSQQAHDIQTGKLGTAPTEAMHGHHLKRRELRIQPGSTAPKQQQHSLLSKTSTVQSHAAGVQPPLDPLDSAALERYMLEASGLLKVRPPIEAALSGDPFVRVMPFQILSWAPRLVVYPAFVDAERCRIIIEYARNQLEKSGLAYKPGEKEDPVGQQTRTSTGTFMSSLNEPTGSLAWVEERIAAATLIPVSHGEPFNLLRYESTQHYDSHLDAFDPTSYGAQDTNRVITAIVILSDVEEGGETVFKREGRGNGTLELKEWRKCDDGVGYKYRPRKGDMIVFHDLYQNGKIDQHALHGGCPVIKGEKWVMTKWLRTRPMIQDTAAELEVFAKQAQIDDAN